MNNEEALAAANPMAHPDYRRFWAARFSTTFGQNMTVVVIAWQAYALARDSYHYSIESSSFILGMIGLAQFLPLLISNPFSGIVSDWFDRRRVAQLMLALEAIVMLSLCGLSYYHAINLSLLFIACAVLGVCNGFSRPALSSIIPHIIPRTILPRAVAMASIAWQSASVMGPVIGGLLFGLNPALPYAVALCLFAIAFAALARIENYTQNKVPPRSPLPMIAEGFKFVWNQKILLGCISLDLFAVLFGGATAMLPVYAKDILHVGPWGLGLLRAAPGMGAVALALYISRAKIQSKVGIKMLGAVAVFGAMTIVFGLSHSMLVSLVALFILGAADMISVITRNTLNQLNTPNEMLGRVNAISSLFISASNELGELESGLLAAVFGPVLSVVAGGVLAICVTILWAGLFPQIRKADRFEPLKQETEDE
jgi:MFS family permease